MEFHISTWFDGELPNSPEADLTRRKKFDTNLVERLALHRDCIDESVSRDRGNQSCHLRELIVATAPDAAPIRDNAIPPRMMASAR